MKATELRIGNLVLLDTGQTLPYPHAIMPSDLDLIHNDNLPKYASIEPIPLTEEWLLKFGFDKICHGMFSHKTSLFTLKLGLKRLGYPYILCHYKNYPKPCKHVHQLQNLYFALTGEELTLKQ